MTTLSRILKMIRLENGEVLRDMAEKLGVTASYLSAVEKGRRDMPKEWIQKIRKLYDVDEKTLERIKVAAEELKKSLKLDLQGASEAQRGAALVFARAFKSMDDKTAEGIRNILNGRRNGI